MTPLTLFCATSNAGKLREFRAASGESIRIEGLPAVDCPEDGDTFEENAVAKALCYSRSAPADLRQSAEGPLHVFADDSGIEVDALGRAPGIYSARFSGPDATDESNNDLLLERLLDVPEAKRTARFVCAIALVRGGGVLQTFLGKAEGRIVETPSGSGGFGYDPLFFYPLLGKTFGELSDSEKWLHSHRGRAFRQMIEWLNKRWPETV